MLTTPSTLAPSTKIACEWRLVAVHAWFGMIRTLLPTRMSVGPKTTALLEQALDDQAGMADDRAPPPRSATGVLHRKGLRAGIDDGPVGCGAADARRENALRASTLLDDSERELSGVVVDVRSRAHLSDSRNRGREACGRGGPDADVVDPDATRSQHPGSSHEAFALLPADGLDLFERRCLV
jgi:hypothetical protein